MDNPETRNEIQTLADTPEIDDGYLSTYTGFEIDRAIGTVRKRESAWDNKQSKLRGTKGMVVGFDERGDAVAQELSIFDLGNFITSWKAEIVLEASAWKDSQQNVYVEGISADESTQLIHPIPFPADFNTYADSQVRVTQSLNQLKFTCEEAPLTDIRMWVVVEELESHEY